MKASSATRNLELFLTFAAIIAFTWPLWVYGYPLLYSDSGTYLISAKIGSIPIDRPYTYSYFLVFFAKLVGVYALPIIQASLVLYFSERFLAQHILKGIPRSVGLLLLIAVALLTGLPHLVCQLMPDLFTPFLFFLSWNIMAKQGWKKAIVDIFFLLFVVATHSSHLLLALFILPLSALSHYFIYKERRVFQKLALMIAVWMIIPSVNLLQSGRYFLSDSSRVFFVASMQNAGVLTPHLETHCGEEGVPEFLCAEKTALKEMSGNDILWASDILMDSACLAQGGWGNCWKVRNEELKPFMQSWWKDENTRNAYLHHAWKATWQQFFDFGIGMISSQKEGSAPHSVLKEFFPNDLAKYEEADQYEHDLYFHGSSKTQWWTLVLSMCMLPVLFLVGLRNKKWKKEWSWMLLGLFLFLLVNAAVCGVLSNPVDRYQARVIWMVPFIVLGMGLSVFWPVTSNERTS